MDGEIERLLWCLLPDFDIQLSREKFRLSLRGRARKLIPERQFRFRPSVLRAARDGLVVTRAVTEERVLDPVIGTAEAVELPALHSRPGRSADGAAVREVKAWIDETLRTHDRPEWRRPWRETANATACQLKQYARVDLSRFRFVLVPRQSHPLVRALILAAEDQDVPVAFLPHSPMTTWQVDLPVAYAGMRGDAERAFAVERTGADPARIAIVGNPDVAVLGESMPLLQPDAPGILALSPDPEPGLREIVELLHAADCANVIVAPHPRSDLRMLRRVVPGHWELHRGRTVELLREGPPWVIQRSSGVAWEAAALGIPTGEVRSRSRAPDYPFLADESIYPALRSPDDVTRFVAWARTADRDRLRAHALKWGSPDGADAVARAQALLDGIDGPRPRIADAWAPGGALRSTSVLRT